MYCNWIDRFIIKSSKSGIPTKQELDDKLEVQTGGKSFPQNH